MCLHIEHIVQSICPVLPKKEESASWTRIAEQYKIKAGLANYGGAIDGVLVPIYYDTDTDPHDYYARSPSTGKLLLTPT